jgi:hypothetical protein
MDNQETGTAILDEKKSLRVENMFLPESRRITKEEFDSLPRYATFNFGKVDGEFKWSAQLTLHNDQMTVAAELPFDVRPHLAEEDQAIFSIQKDGKKLVYPVLDRPTTIDVSSDVTKSYYIDELSPRRTEVDKSSIKKMKANEAAEVLSNITGEDLIFYTGAGISMGGDKPVWDMSQLWGNLGLKGDGEDFLKVFKDPTKYPPSNLLSKVDTFGKQLFDDVSTPAHEAISEILDLKKGAVVFTENIDLKHEAEGSRLGVIHMDSDNEAFTKVKLRSHANVLITVGLSKDDRAVIQYLKQQNPDLKIIAFTLSEKSIPEYLDSSDAVVLGDAQETLPALANKMANQKFV